MMTIEISRPKITPTCTALLPPKGFSSDPVATLEDDIIAGHGACKKCGCGGFVKNDPANGRCAYCNHSFHVHEGWA